ncbi:gp15 tail sheath stabilizer and completion protein [Acinetobacter phage Acj9]|uniref:Gp15 tail sheath stabilizer and completion protein n=1 Tax=Acinetobacter phage Acj9 TaxID=760939 RepID=E5EPV8_9CAUD|nr:gp15 tail sheath stabilizer and completion protein [Acinetobacter phage Acj9]ADG60074.1 gp15 tail sheath stabilizer and completion protein [Acinetobacter phage Acj9]
MGDLFSHVQVMRKQDDGKLELIRVPITYASKERFAMKLDSITSVNKDGPVAKLETILPRMCLNMVDIVYNAPYKTALTNRTLANEKESTKLISQYNPVPVRMIFELGIYTRHQDDMFQIIEQIWPYFQPHFSTQMKELFGNDIVFDRNIRVVLQSLALDNQLETDNTTRRRLETNFIFEVNGWLYPPVAEIKGEIHTIYIDLFANEKTLDNSGATFESIDTQVAPPDSTREDWQGEILQTQSENVKIPTGTEPSAPRRN